MKAAALLLILSLVILSQSRQQQQSALDLKFIQQLQEQLQSLDPLFLQHFISYYHPQAYGSNEESGILNIKRVSYKQSTYLLLVAKMYLYGVLSNGDYEELRYYNTKSNYLAAYYYLRVAAEYYENREAYYLLGILQHFKLVPDKLLQTNIEALPSKTPNHLLLLKYLQQSHLYNAESNLFMSSALGHHPASLVLGYMNKHRLGTSKNCTAALAYYLSVVKSTYVDEFFFRQVYDIDDSLEDQLYSRKKIAVQKIKMDNHFIEKTDYYDEEIIEATKDLADSLYMGTQGHLRNTTKAALLYEKLAQGGNGYGKVMAGLCYFKGEGVPVNRLKAYKFFSDVPKSQIADYMLLSMKYYEIIQKGSKEKALATMLQRYKGYKKNKEKISSHTSYLIASVILRGELKDKDKDGKDILVPESDAYQLLDQAAAQGNTYAKIMLALLFADGANGLKYGCEQSVKYFSEEALGFPYFKDSISTAQYALKNGETLYPLIKYMQLAMIGYENAYINLLYLMEVYGDSVLNMKSTSWSISNFKTNRIYKELNENGLVDVESFILSRYRIKGKAVLNLNNIEGYLIADTNSVQEYHSYMRKKIIKWGSIFDRKNILKYYDYKLTYEEKGNYLPLLTSLASGDSSKLYVGQARYLLGKHYHQKALENKTKLTPSEHFRILGEYNRAVKSELLGLVIFHIEQYLLGKDVTFDFFESEVGEDLLSYIFVLSIVIFVLYYMRSKKMDHFHKVQLEKQLRKATQQQVQKEQSERLKENSQSKPVEQELMMEPEQQDDTQPVITEDEPKGVRIGSNYEESM